MPGSWLPTRQTPSSRSGRCARAVLPQTDRQGTPPPASGGRAAGAQAGGQEAAAAPEPALFGCWVSPGWSRNLTTDGHRDWPDLPVPEDGPAGSRPWQSPGGIGHIACRSAATSSTPTAWASENASPRGDEAPDLPGFLHDYFTPFAKVGGSLAAPLELARHLVWGAVDHAPASASSRPPSSRPRPGTSVTGGDQRHHLRAGRNAVLRGRALRQPTSHHSHPRPSLRPRQLTRVPVPVGSTDGIRVPTRHPHTPPIPGANFAAPKPRRPRPRRPRPRRPTSPPPTCAGTAANTIAESLSSAALP